MSCETAVRPVPDAVFEVNSTISAALQDSDLEATIGDLVLLIRHAIKVQAPEHCKMSFRIWMRSLCMHESLWPEIEGWDQSLSAMEAFYESCLRFRKNLSSL